MRQGCNAIVGCHLCEVAVDLFPRQAHGTDVARGWPGGARLDAPAPLRRTRGLLQGKSSPWKSIVAKQPLSLSIAPDAGRGARPDSHRSCRY